MRVFTDAAKETTARKLLEEVLSDFLRDGRWPLRQQFRHERLQNRKILDALEEHGFLRKSNKDCEITLKGIGLIVDTAKAEVLFRVVDALHLFLRERYCTVGEGKVDIKDIVLNERIPAPEASAALYVISSTMGACGGHSGSSDYLVTSVSNKERILDVPPVRIAALAQSETLGEPLQSSLVHIRGAAHLLIAAELLQRRAAPTGEDRQGFWGREKNAMCSALALLSDYAIASILDVADENVNVADVKQRNGTTFSNYSNASLQSVSEDVRSLTDAACGAMGAALGSMKKRERDGAFLYLFQLAQDYCGPAGFADRLKLLWRANGLGVDETLTRLHKTGLIAMDKGNTPVAAGACRVSEKGDAVLRNLLTGSSGASGWAQAFTSDDAASGVAGYDMWEQVTEEFAVTKRKLAKRIPYVLNRKVRAIIYRDIEDAMRCKQHSLWKPSVILAGGVVECLMRNLVDSVGDEKKVRTAYKEFFPERKHKKPETLEEYIGVCRHLGLVDGSIADLLSAVRGWRNLVHPDKERRSALKPDKNMAETALRSIFQLVLYAKYRP